MNSFTNALKKQAIALPRSMSSSTSSSLVHFTHDADTKIGFLTLNSPGKQNALTVEMASEFQTKVEQINSMISMNEININSLVLKGANATFSAGGDLTWLKSLSENPVHVNADIMYNFYRSYLSIRDIPVPVIAGIEGYAVGAGACLALATDMRLMSSSAKIGFNFVKLGIHSGMGGSHLLPNIVGESRAKDILLTGKMLKAEEAASIGIAHRLVEKEGEEFTEEVIDVAKEIGSHHPLAVRSMVRTTRMREDVIGGGLDAALRREAHAQALCFARNDWGEGLDAAVERRQPSFDDYNNDWL